MTQDPDTEDSSTRDIVVAERVRMVRDVSILLDIAAGLREVLLVARPDDLGTAVAARLDLEAGLAEVLPPPVASDRKPCSGTSRTDPAASSPPARLTRADGRRIGPSTTRRLWVAGLVPGLALIVIAIFVGVLAAGPVNTDPTAAPTSRALALQAQITRYLADNPGGKQINGSEVSYEDGKFIVTFGVQAPSSGLVPDCPAGSFCFYDQPDYQGSRGRLSGCGWQDLAMWGWNDRIESAYYNMSSGSVDFINHVGPADHVGDLPLFSLSPTRRGLQTVHPYPNTADHVYRHC